MDKGEQRRSILKSGFPERQFWIYPGYRVVVCHTLYTDKPVPPEVTSRPSAATGWGMLKFKTNLSFRSDGRGREFYLEFPHPNVSDRFWVSWAPYRGAPRQFWQEEGHDLVTSEGDGGASTTEGAVKTILLLADRRNHASRRELTISVEISRCVARTMPAIATCGER